MFKKLVVFFLIALISTPFAIADKDPKPASSSSNKDGKVQTIGIKYKGFDAIIIIDDFEWKNKTPKEQELIRKRFQLEVDICEKMDIRFNGKGIYDFRMLNITPEQLSVRYILQGKEYGLETIRAVFNGSHDSNIRFVKFCSNLKKKQDKVMNLINKCYSNCPEMAGNLPIIEDKMNNITQNYQDLTKKPIQMPSKDETPIQGAKKDNSVEVRKETNLIIPTNLPKDELDIHELLLKYNKTYKDIIKMLEDGVDNLTMQKKTGINFSYFSNNAAPDLHNVYKFRSRAPLPKEAGKKSSTNPRAYYLYDAKNNKWILLHCDYKRFVGPEKPKEVQSLLNLLKDRIKSNTKDDGNKVSLENEQDKQAANTVEPTNTEKSNKSDWDSKQEELKKYVEANNSYPDRKTSLGGWLNNQKTAYRKGKLSSEQISKLESIPNWKWHQTKEQTEKTPEPQNNVTEQNNVSEWDRNVKLLEKYISNQEYTKKRVFTRRKDKKRNRYYTLKNYVDVKNMPTKETRVVDENGNIVMLGEWLSNVIEQHKNGELTQEQISQLESIEHFTWELSKVSKKRDKMVVSPTPATTETDIRVDANKILEKLTDRTSLSETEFEVLYKYFFEDNRMAPDNILIQQLSELEGMEVYDHLYQRAFKDAQSTNFNINHVTLNYYNTSNVEFEASSDIRTNNDNQAIDTDIQYEFENEAKTLSVEELISEANIIFERIINTDVLFDQMEPRELDILYRYFFENHRGVPDSELTEQLSLLEGSELFDRLYNRAFIDAETNSKFDINPVTLSYFSDRDMTVHPEDVNTQEMFNINGAEENEGPKFSIDFNKSNNTTKQPGTTDGEAAVLEPVNTPPKKPTPLAGANQIPVEEKKPETEIKGNQTELVEIEVTEEQYKDIVVPILGDNNKDPLFDFLNLAKQLNINVSDRVTNKLSTFSNITPESWSQLYILMLTEYENNNFCALCSAVTSLIYSDAEIPREIWEMAINLLNNNEIDNDVRQTLGKAILSPNNTTIPSELMLNIGIILNGKDLITNWEGQIRRLNKIPTIEELFGTTLNTINNAQEETPLTKTEVEISDNPLRPEIDRIMIEWNDILKEYKRVSLNTLADLFDKGKISKELLQYLISTKNSNGKENFPLVTTLAIAISKLSSDEANQTRFIQILEDTYKKDPNKVEDILVETSKINHTPSTPKEKMQEPCIFNPLNEKEINIFFDSVSIKQESIFSKNKKVSISGLNQKIEASKVKPTEQHLITELQRSLGSQTNDLKNLLDEYILSLAVKVGESEPMDNKDIRLVFGYDNCNYLSIYDYLLENPNKENKDLLIFLGVSTPKTVDPNISAKIQQGFSLTGLFYSTHAHTMKIVTQDNPAQKNIITDISNRLYERFLIPKNFIETRMIKK